MLAVVMLVRSELRRRWRSLAVVALLVAFAGGVTLALLVSLPIGVVAGRWLWGVLADDLGIVNESKVSTVALAIVVAVALANLVAAFPARTAARTPAATVLRSE